MYARHGADVGAALHEEGGGGALFAPAAVEVTARAVHVVGRVHQRGRAQHLQQAVARGGQDAFLGRERVLPRMEPGELLAVLSAGAYGASMASNYNTRRRPAEVLVDGFEAALVRRRETFQRMFADELEARS